MRRRASPPINLQLVGSSVRLRKFHSLLPKESGRLKRACGPQRVRDQHEYRSSLARGDSPAFLPEKICQRHLSSSLRVSCRRNPAFSIELSISRHPRCLTNIFIDGALGSRHGSSFSLTLDGSKLNRACLYSPLGVCKPGRFELEPRDVCVRSLAPPDITSA